MSLEFWKNASPLVRRIITITIVFIFAVIITVAGTWAPIKEQEAEEIHKELNQTINSLKTNNLLVQYVFGNNFMFTLIMFVPVIGVVFGAYVLYNTGAVIAAIAISKKVPPALYLIALFLTPIAWLEFIAYSTAMAESIWLAHRLWQRRGKHEIINACKFISVCAVILLVAAIIEAVMIYSVP
ncbi:MAG: stage II sporulation protein M [Candidatus Bathyarchaeota archaeon]|nr:stage II sporulation protein M [Candidatus Bathyarchaeota archaeon]